MNEASRLSTEARPAMQTRVRMIFGRIRWGCLQPSSSVLTPRAAFAFQLTRLSIALPSSSREPRSKSAASASASHCNCEPASGTNIQSSCAGHLYDDTRLCTDLDKAVDGHTIKAVALKYPSRPAILNFPEENKKTSQNLFRNFAIYFNNLVEICEAFRHYECPPRLVCETFRWV